jgi:uncharacterized membrane protein SpoIIM required for sporulation
VNPEQIGLYILLGWASLAIPIGFMFALYPDRQTERLLNSVRKHATKEKWEGLSAHRDKLTLMYLFSGFLFIILGIATWVLFLIAPALNWH